MTDIEFSELAVLDESFRKREHILREFIAAHGRENQLLFFFKPECFIPGVCGYPEKVIRLSMAQFRRFDVQVLGSVYLPGHRLAEWRIMERHYGYIARLSRHASRCLTAEERDAVLRELGRAQDHDVEILGGHECLDRYRHLTADELDELWLRKESLKMKSGFYCQRYSVSSDDIVIVNGFCPRQLSHYTNPGRGILVLLLETDCDWRALKEELVGDTFPERASPNSIRGELLRDKASYGIGHVSIAANFVHLSAGPFEAMFEIDNCLKDVEQIGFSFSRTHMYGLLAAAEVEDAEVRKCLANPQIRCNSQEVPLFSLTENMNSRDAVEKYLERRGTL